MLCACAHLAPCASQLVTSQVSEIPAKLSQRWTKERRFDAAWEEVRRARPRRVLQLGGKVVNAENVQEGFEALEQGEVAVVAIDLKGRKV